MNLLDFFIVLPVGYFAWKGFTSGFIKEVLSIAGIILAVFLTFKYMDSLSPVFEMFFFEEDSQYAPIVAGIFIFVFTIAAVQFIAHISQRFLELIKINFINRLAGLIFGSLKSAIVISAVLLLLAGFNLPGETTRSGSATYPIVITVAPAVFDMVSSLYPGAENFIETIERAIEENNPIRNLPIFERTDT